MCVSVCVCVCACVCVCVPVCVCVSVCVPVCVCVCVCVWVPGHAFYSPCVPSLCSSKCYGRTWPALGRSGGPVERRGLTMCHSRAIHGPDDVQPTRRSDRKVSARARGDRRPGCPLETHPAIARVKHDTWTCLTFAGRISALHIGKMGQGLTPSRKTQNKLKAEKLQKINRWI